MGYQADTNTQIILHTKNAGKNWDTQDLSNLGSIRKFFFLDDKNGFAVGSTKSNTPLVLRTSDKGKTFEKLSIPMNVGYVSDIFFLNPFEGWIILNTFHNQILDTALLRTIDGGVSWQRLQYLKIITYFQFVSKIQTRELLPVLMLPHPCILVL